MFWLNAALWKFEARVPRAVCDVPDRRLISANATSRGEAGADMEISSVQTCSANRIPVSRLRSAKHRGAGSRRSIDNHYRLCPGAKLRLRHPNCDRPPAIELHLGGPVSAVGRGGRQLIRERLAADVIAVSRENVRR